MIKQFAAAMLVVVFPFTATMAQPDKMKLVLKSMETKANQSVFVFAGSGMSFVHRAGPEHFKLVRVSDGKGVATQIEYDRDAFDVNEGGLRSVTKKSARARNVYSFNYQFKGVRLHLETGPMDLKDVAAVGGALDLYCRATLVAGERYRLTWACWPLGAQEAVCLTCEFQVPK